MAKQTLLYRGCFPLIPDGEWFSSRQLHDILLPHLPHLKLANLRVNLTMWEKRELILSKPKEIEIAHRNDKEVYIHHPKYYRKAISVYHGVSLVHKSKSNSRNRRCLCCNNIFWPEGKYNFMCMPCSQMYHD